MGGRITRTPSERAARAVVIGLLGRMRDGAVIVHDGDRRFLCGRPVAGERVPEVRVVAPEAWRAVATEGSAGLGRAWFSGWWTCGDPADLTAFLRVVVRNLEAVDLTSTAASRLSAPLRPLRAAQGHGDAERGGRTPVRELLEDGRVAALLDESMACSAALFASPSVGLAEAQRVKLDRLCRKLHVGPADHVLELGTGFATFALHAARAYGCRVTAVVGTETERQVATGRVKEEGLEDLVTVQAGDPGELSGTYDKLAVVESIHRLDGRAQDAFVEACARLLSPGGLLALQAVVVADQLYERAKRSEDFTTRYVLPGSSLPSVTSLVEAATRRSDLRLVALDDIGPHYAETLRRWRRRLADHATELEALGVDEPSRRLLEFHLAYREAACTERRISAVQCVLARGRWRQTTLALPER